MKIKMKRSSKVRAHLTLKPSEMKIILDLLERDLQSGIKRAPEESEFLNNILFPKLNAIWEDSDTN